MLETGKISGEVKNGHISFQKYMPIETLIHPKLGKILNPEKKHPTLYYKGKLNTESLQCNGTWKFNKKIAFLFGIIPIIYSPGKGTWEMGKINN